MQNKLNLRLLIGAPGSGKSTWGKELVDNDPNAVRVCPDEFRAKFGWGEGDQTVSSQAFAAAREATDAFLSQGKDVVIDATNMHAKARGEFIKIARKYNAKVHAYVFHRSKEILLERNRIRGESGGRNVPEYVIDSMLNKYQAPTSEEVDTITFVN